MLGDKRDLDEDLSLSSVQSDTRTWWRPQLQLAAFAILSTIVSWIPGGLASGKSNTLELMPQAGRASAWQFGLAYSAVHHVSWGPGFDFTYGPLGFLTVQTLWFGSSAALSFVYLFLVRLSLFALLFHFTRKNLPIWLAALISYVIGATAINMVDPGDIIMAPTLLLGIMALRAQNARARLILVIILSSIAGAGFFIKFTAGVLALGVVVIVVATESARSRLRDSSVSVAVLFLVMVLVWLGTGNQLSDLPSYFKYSIAIASGYSGAMQIEAGRANDWLYAAFVLLLVAFLAYRSLRSRSRREQIGTAIVLGWYSWVVVKESFIRHDEHAWYFFGLMLVTLVIFDLSVPAARSVLLAAIAITTVVVWTAFGVVPQNVFSLATDTHAFAYQTLTIADSQRRDSTIATAQAEMRAVFAITPKMSEELNGQTVAIEPLENDVAYAYQSMHWDPEPVLQTYSAYTASLDELDSNFIASPKAPSRILEESPLFSTIDNRYLAFESPTTFVTTVCRYVQLDQSVAWQVLERVPDRCGASHHIDTVTATVGVPVRVPRAPVGAIVVACIDLTLPLSYKIAAFAFKPPYVTFSAWGTTPSIGGTQTALRFLGNYRFIAATAGSVHLLQPSPMIGYATEYTPPSISSFAISGGYLSPRSQYSVSFYRMKVGRW